ncbi:MAG: cupin domain-containing protein [Thermodesulfobacteriota bacterium]|nr:cupin domain-containing protein [Thermodesulfobacteriota bacterium]
MLFSLNTRKVVIQCSAEKDIMTRDMINWEDKRTGMKRSLLEQVPEQLPEELTEVLCASECVRIERIVSRGHSSPKGFWYDQETDEFVLLVQGRAAIRVHGREDMIILEPGDYIHLGAHVRHRVEWTDPERATLWLVVHYSMA